MPSLLQSGGSSSRTCGAGEGGAAVRESTSNSTEPAAAAVQGSSTNNNTEAAQRRQQMMAARPCAWRQCTEVSCVRAHVVLTASLLLRLLPFMHECLCVRKCWEYCCWWLRADLKSILGVLHCTLSCSVSHPLQAAAVPAHVCTCLYVFGVCLSRQLLAHTQLGSAHSMKARHEKRDTHTHTCACPRSRVLLCRHCHLQH